ncbi:DUF4118 domain-containing protein [Azoarcus olearius]|uniref:histidine kinase n=1 Tax=Azoarcus sp. (strain BH72) TaxID=418699 RepID=A1KA55_AZOSB|nr:DUF4118 domain-containing protein [Azoarcus olearius]CAL95711.1 probable sensor for high-affinity potassium transport system [Azoarcus olearius]
MGVGRLAGLSVPVRHLVAATLCALAAAAVYPLRQLLEPANVVMLLLLVVAFNAAWLGRGPAVLGTVVSVALFDFLFVPPQLSFAVSDVKYLITFAVMLLVSLLIGQLTVSLRASADEAALRERRSHALYALARSLAGAMLPAQVMEQVAAFVRTEAGAEVHFHLPDEDDGALHPQPAGVPAPGVAETTAAAGIFFTPAEGQAGCVAVAGVGLMLPLHGATRCRGVMVVQPGAAAAPLESLRPLLEAVASLAAIALERLHFVAVAQASQFEAEAERLRNSILASISHDIRTPLTVLFGLADALALSEGRLGSEEREAAHAIRDQAGRLHDMVDKLLDMARLQAGTVRLRKEWQPLDEILGAAIALLGDALRAHPVTLVQAAETPLVAVDAVLLERVFCNLLDNAARCSPAGTPITVDLAREGDMLVVGVRDHGPGFPAGGERAFELFERGRASGVAGVGLGLAICRAVVEAHGGWIRAGNAADGGACVRFALPCGEAPVIEPEAGVEAQA